MIMKKETSFEKEHHYFNLMMLTYFNSYIMVSILDHEIHFNMANKFNLFNLTYYNFQQYSQGSIIQKYHLK